MKKQLLTITLTVLTTIATFAQEVWLDTDNSISLLTLTTDACGECSTSTVANPDATDTEATNVLLWKIDAAPETTGETVGNKKLEFSFPDDYVLTPTDFTSLTITVRLYAPNLTNFTNFDSLTRFRFYLGGQQVQIKHSDIETELAAGWYNLVYDFSGKVFTENVTSGDIRLIGQSNRFTNLDNDIDFHIDTITSSVALTLDENSNDDLPEEAVLDAGNEWYHSYSPDTFSLTLNEVQGGIFLEQGSAVATPTTNGNSSPLVAKFTKEDEASSQLKFQLPVSITTENQSSAIFKIRAYVPSTNLAPTDNNRRFRLFLRNGDSNTGQKNVTFDVTTFDAWQEYTFDFTATNLTEESYTTVNLLFDQPDSAFDATGNVYYLDAFQGPSAATLPVKDFELNKVSIVAYPNPVTNSFQIESSINIENVKLYNITGRLLRTFNDKTNYDISDLATGLYIANIETQFGSKTLRIVKE